MRYDIAHLKADVYEVEEANHEGFIWNFGYFNLYGDENRPFRSSSNYNTWNSVINNRDISEFEEENSVELVGRKEAKFYVGDYAAYIEAKNLKSANYLVQEEYDNIYKIIVSGIEKTEPGGIKLIGGINGSRRTLFDTKEDNLTYLRII